MAAPKIIQKLDTNLVPIKGEYNATPPTYLDGDVVVPQYDSRGRALSSIAGDASTTSATSSLLFSGGTGSALLTNSAVVVKASSGFVASGSLVNTGGSDSYVQFFDLAAASVVLGTTVPRYVFWVPAGGAWDIDAPINFATAISAAATTTTTGSTAPAVGILVNLQVN